MRKQLKRIVAISMAFIFAIPSPISAERWLLALALLQSDAYGMLHELFWSVIYTMSIEHLWGKLLSDM